MSPRSRRRPELPPMETDEDNVVRQEQAKGTVRPDGPGDATAPVDRELPTRGGTSTPRHRGIPLKTPKRTAASGRTKPAASTEAKARATARKPTKPPKPPKARGRARR